MPPINVRKNIDVIELATIAGGSGAGTAPDVPYDIDGYLTEINTGKIDADYMNSKFEKYLVPVNFTP